MQSHTTDPLKYPLYSEKIRVCVYVCVGVLSSSKYCINKSKSYNQKTVFY